MVTTELFVQKVFKVYMKSYFPLSWADTVNALHKKMNFSIKEFSVNVTKSAISLILSNLPNKSLM